MNDDAQLVESTLAGDTAAFGQLVERHQDRLHHAVYRFLGSTEDARDIVQDAFVQAFVKLETFRGGSAFFTWLYRIAFNLAMSHARRRRPTQSLDAAKDAVGSEPQDGRAGPHDQLLCRERAQVVHAALQTLSDEHRQVVVLRELEGCSYEVIAEVLEVPVGTVRSRLFRARLELRAQLANLLPEEVKQPSS